MLGKQKLSKGEMETVRVLWSLQCGTVREVHDTLAAERPIEFGTVQTYLRRLEAKGYVRSKLDGRVRIYSARIKPDCVIRETVADIVGRLFGGRAMPLMRHLIQQGEMSQDDIEELRQLVQHLTEANADD
jgi:BlaI family transcriptional regulator, penicillinase repressor